MIEAVYLLILAIVATDSPPTDSLLELVQGFLPAETLLVTSLKPECTSDVPISKGVSESKFPKHTFGFKHDFERSDAFDSPCSHQTSMS